MAKIAVPVTQPGLQRIEPAPMQRRVIALELHAPQGVGNTDFCYTPQLGNRLWLYGLDVWVYCSGPGAFIGGFFYLMYGTFEPRTQSDIATRWTRIIPLHCGSKPGFRWFECEAFHRHFSMARLFTADGLRFGVTIENGFNQDWECTVAFEIAEG